MICFTPRLTLQQGHDDQDQAHNAVREGEDWNEQVGELQREEPVRREEMRDIDHNLKEKGGTSDNHELFLQSGYYFVERRVLGEEVQRVEEVLHEQHDEGHDQQGQYQIR